MVVVSWLGAVVGLPDDDDGVDGGDAVLCDAEAPPVPCPGAAMAMAGKATINAPKVT